VGNFVAERSTNPFLGEQEAMPAYVADLHHHTPHVIADYRGPADTSADDIVRAAVAAGIDILGATDHFCCAYLDKLGEAAARLAEETGQQLLMLGGAELKLRTGEDVVHLIALYESCVAGKRIKEVLAEFGVVCPADTSHELPSLVANVDPIKVAAAVRERGGIAIAAHVDQVFDGYRLTDSSYFMEIVYSDCFDAIEVTRPSTAEWLHQMSTPALIASSDAHAPSEMGRRRTLVAMGELSYAELKLALDRGSSVPMLDDVRAGVATSDVSPVL